MENEYKIEKYLTRLENCGDSPKRAIYEQKLMEYGYQEGGEDALDGVKERANIAGEWFLNSRLQK